MLLVRAAVSARALERLGQQRVRQCLAGDPLAVERVGLAALAGAIRTRRAIRAHISHVMAAAGQEHRRMPAPARRPLDPPAGDLPKLPRPRLQLTVPLTRDAKVSRGENPAARIGDRRTQRALVRIDPDHVARMIGRHQQVRRSRTALLDTPHPTSPPAVWCWRTGRQHPGGRPHGRTLLSGQADPRRQEPRPTLRPQDTLAGVNRIRSQTSVRLRPYANRRPRRATRFNTWIAFAFHPQFRGRAHRRRLDRGDRWAGASAWPRKASSVPRRWRERSATQGSPRATMGPEPTPCRAPGRVAPGVVQRQPDADRSALATATPLRSEQPHGGPAVALMPAGESSSGADCSRSPSGRAGRRFLRCRGAPRPNSQRRWAHDVKIPRPHSAASAVSDVPCPLRRPIGLRPRDLRQR